MATLLIYLPFVASRLLPNLCYFSILFCLTLPAYRFDVLFTLTHPSFCLHLFGLTAFFWIFPPATDTFFFIFKTLHNSVRRLSCVVLIVFAARLYLGMSDQCFLSFAVKENWSVTFLLFYSGNLLGLVYFAASIYYFTFFFVFHFRLSSTSPEVPKDYILFYYSVFRSFIFCLRVVGTRKFTLNSYPSLPCSMLLFYAHLEILAAQKQTLTVLSRNHLLCTLTDNRPRW